MTRPRTSCPSSTSTTKIRLASLSRASATPISLFALPILYQMKTRSPRKAPRIRSLLKKIRLARMRSPIKTKSQRTKPTRRRVVKAMRPRTSLRALTRRSARAIRSLLTKAPIRTSRSRRVARKTKTSRPMRANLTTKRPARSPRRPSATINPKAVMLRRRATRRTSLKRAAATQKPRRVPMRETKRKVMTRSRRLVVTKNELLLLISRVNSIELEL